jgi:hypothetical protein
MARRVAPVALVVALVVAFGADTVDAAGVPPTDGPPSIAVSPNASSVDANVRIELNGWTVPIVLVSVCGDAAHRGSQDCNQVGSVGVVISPQTAAGSGVIRVRPPIGCPCLVRATTPDNSIVRTAPLRVVGFTMLAPSQMFRNVVAPADHDVATTRASAAPPRRLGGPSPVVWSLVLAGVLGGAMLALMAARRRPAPVAGWQLPDEQRVNTFPPDFPESVPLTSVPPSGSGTREA